MAYALVQEFPVQPGDRSTANYDAIHEAIMTKAAAPTGLIIHTAGFTGDTFRIFEIWESREQCDAFMHDVVMPTVMEVTKGNPADPPTTTTYELHNVMLPQRAVTG
jgi:quinol monooxygenase YgiN